MARTGRADQGAFFFNPMPEARVSVFDLQQRRVERWQSIFNHPAFVYFGPLRAKETRDVVAIADPAAPKWIAKEFHDVAPPIFDYLGEFFRFELVTKPNVFLSYKKGGPTVCSAIAAMRCRGSFRFHSMAAAG